MRQMWIATIVLGLTTAGPAFYQAYRNITLGFTGFFGRQLLTATSPTAAVAPEHFLKRFQFDLIYKF